MWERKNGSITIYPPNGLSLSLQKYGKKQKQKVFIACAEPHTVSNLAWIAASCVWVKVYGFLLRHGKSGAEEVLGLDPLNYGKRGLEGLKLELKNSREGNQLCQRR